MLLMLLPVLQTNLWSALTLGDICFFYLSVYCLLVLLFYAYRASVSGGIAFLGVRSTLCIILSSISMLFC